MITKDNVPHFHGHRKRLKDKFLCAAFGSFADYELVELLLFGAIPRKDVKPLAKKLLTQFGSLANLIYADQDKLLEIEGTNIAFYLAVKLVREILDRTLQSTVLNNNVLSSWGDLLKYLQNVMGHIKHEQFRILFLNKKNNLIADEIQANGTIDQTPVYPREVVRRALFYGATALILVHNHPSGDANPSKADIELTKHIAQACNAVNVVVHDHVVVTKNQTFSFKHHMLL